ncbi:MAG TPA: lytic murein transglycosylase [Deltaproteobacteria bacterium]|nr:lytic murein transglycosylase [Deltaproteobacteria bacterium]
MKRLMQIVVMGLCLWGSPVPARAAEEPDVHFIENLLVDKGFERAYVQEVFSDPRICYDNDVIIKNLYRPKATAKTAPRTVARPTPPAAAPTPAAPAAPRPAPGKPMLPVEPVYIERGRAFIQDQARLLTELDHAYGVAPQAVTAILIVESRLGRYYEVHHVFNAFLNMAACLDPDFFAAVVAYNRERYPEMADPDTALSAVKRGEWALTELGALMDLARAIDMDPCEIRGSYAGAVGPAQFIPSSFQSLGVDGDSDGIRDPFNMVDAMASIANYLKRAGWKNGAGQETLRQAIWHYNHSQAYVNTVMMLYEELSKG